MLGTETRVTKDGPERGSIIWIVINGRLWRCAPSQLRRASEREHQAFRMDNPKPWTFQEILGSMAFAGQYTDVAAEGEPDLEAEILRDQPGAIPAFPPDDVRQEEVDVPPDVPPDPQRLMSDEAMEPLGRLTRTQAQSKKKPRRKVNIDQELTETEDARKRSREDGPQHVRRRLRFKTPFGPRIQPQPRRDIADLEEVQQEVMAAYEQYYDLGENPTLVVMDFPELENERQWKELLRRPECYMANNLRRKR